MRIGSRVHYAIVPYNKDYWGILLARGGGSTASGMNSATFILTSPIL